MDIGNGASLELVDVFC